MAAVGMVGLSLPRLHLVTDGEVLAGAGFPDLVASLLEAGGSRVALHLRGRGRSGAELWERAAHCAEIAERTGSVLLINDRIDVALGCGAHGVQLGWASFPVGTARELLGRDRLIGASVHDLGEGRTAAEGGADFLVAGTLYRSGSHPGRQPRGLDWLRPLGELGLPVIGIGGVKPGRVRAVVGAPAHGIAAIRAVWAASRPVDALHELLAELE